MVFTQKKKRKKTDQSSDELMVAMESIFNGISQREEKLNLFKNFIETKETYYYIARLSDYVVVWISDYIRDNLGVNVIGMKCYEAFHSFGEPCSFCNNDDLSKEEGKISIVPFYNNQLKRLFIIESSVKKMTFNDVEDFYRFERGVDITDLIPSLVTVIRKFNLHESCRTDSV